MKSMKKLLALMMAAMMLFALAACGSDNGGNDANTNDNNNSAADNNGGTEEKTKLIVGTSADYAPYEFHTMDNGKDVIVGADIDMINNIAEEMNVDIEIKDISFDVLLNELQNGTIDIVIAGMSADEDRLAQADASDIYYDAAYQRVVVRAEDADKYHSFEDFKGAKVGMQAGTVQVGLAEEYMPDCDPLILQAVPDIFNNLINGKCDAALVDGPVGDGYIESNDGLAAIELDFGAQDGFSIWVKKGDPKNLLEGINAAIAKFNESGKYAEWLSAAEELADAE